MRKVCGNIPQNLKSLAKKDYFFFPIVLPHTFFFDIFFAKNFVDSIIIVTFAVSYPCWKLQLGKGGVDIYT